MYHVFIVLSSVIGTPRRCIEFEGSNKTASGHAASKLTHELPYLEPRPFPFLRPHPGPCTAEPPWWRWAVGDRGRHGLSTAKLSDEIHPTLHWLLRPKDQRVTFPSHPQGWGFLCGPRVVTLSNSPPKRGGFFPFCTRMASTHYQDFHDSF